MMRRGFRNDRWLSGVRIASGTMLMILMIASVAHSEQFSVPTTSTVVPLPPQQRLVIHSEDLFPLTRPTRVAMFTLAPPETNGEVVRVAIPIGELASRAARAISDARHRRAERKVDRRIARELQQFKSSDRNSEPRN